MAYTRLNVQDLVDRWNAAKVDHLENGIEYNDTRLNRLFQKDGASLSTPEQLRALNAIGASSYEEFLASLCTANIGIMASANAIGEKIGCPTFSFDGNIEDKEVINFGEGISYVKVSDEAITSNLFYATMGGAMGIVYDSMMGMFGPIIGTEESGDDRNVNCNISVEVSDKTINNITNICPFVSSNNEIYYASHTDLNSLSSCVIKINEYCTHLQIEISGNNFSLSTIGGPTVNPNPGWELSNTASTNYIRDYTNIKAGSYIYIISTDPNMTFKVIATNSKRDQTILYQLGIAGLFDLWSCVGFKEEGSVTATLIMPYALAETFGGIFAMFAEMPPILTSTKPFTYMEYEFDSGTYIPYFSERIEADSSPDIPVPVTPGDFPLYFIKNIWDLDSPIKNATKNAINLNQLNFNARSVLNYSGHSILWDGKSSLSTSLDNINKVSNEIKLFNILKNIGAITLKYSDGSSCITQFELDTTGKCGIVMDGEAIQILIPTTTYKLNRYDAPLDPGVYFPCHLDGEKYVTEIICHNVNIEKFMSHKLPKDAYDRLGYEETSQEIGQTINYAYNSADKTIDFSTIADIPQPEATQIYTLISNKDIELEDIDIMYYANRESNIVVNTVMVEESSITVDNITNIYPFIYDETTGYYKASHTAEDGDAISSAIVRINNYCNSMQLNYSNADSTLRGYISEIGGPTNNPNPAWQWTTTNLTTSYSNIKAGSYMYIVSKDPTAQFKLSNISPVSVTKTIVTNNLVLPNEKWSDIQFVEITPTIKAMALYNTEGVFDQYALLNVLEDASIIGDVSLSKGLYGIVTKPDVNNVVYVSKICTKDGEKAITIHKIEEKYLPDIPTFNFVELGLADLPISGSFSNLSVIPEDLSAAAEKGPIKVIVNTEAFGQVSAIVTCAQIDNAYQFVHSAYLNNSWYDLIVQWSNTGSVDARLLPRG